MNKTPDEDKKMQRLYRHRRLIATLVIVFLAVPGVAALTLLPKRKDKKKQVDRGAVPVKVMRVTPHEQFVDEFILPGTVEPDFTMTVSAEVAATIDSIDCKEGTPCKKGDVLINLNRDLLDPQVKQAEAQRVMDKYELDRLVELHARGGATNFELQQAKARLAGAEAVEATARARLDRTRIAAPVTGFLNRLLVEKGEYVTPGKALAQIVDNRKVRVIVDVPERDTPYITYATKATILLDVRNGDNEETLPGSIDYISQVADPAARTTRAEILTDNASGILHSGQIVRVRLQRRVLKNTILIPLAAVIPMEKLWAVYVVQDGKACRRIVNLGFLKGHNVQVIPVPRATSNPAVTAPAEATGLQDGDMLIVEGNRQVADGQEVQQAPTTGDSDATYWSAGKP